MAKKRFYSREKYPMQQDEYSNLLKPGKTNQQGLPTEFKTVDFPRCGAIGDDVEDSMSSMDKAFDYSVNKIRSHRAKNKKY